MELLTKNLYIKKLIAKAAMKNAIMSIFKNENVSIIKICCSMKI